MKAARGYHVVDVRGILYAQADSRFSRLYLANGSSKAVFHTLFELEGILSCGRRVGDLFFLRLHKSYIVALHHAAEMDRAAGVLLTNGSRLPISRSEWAGSIPLGVTIRGAI